MATLSPPISPEPGYDHHTTDHHTTGYDNHTRPRAVSALSHGSQRSRRSSGSGNKLELVESISKKKLNTKADPSKALTESQPSAVAQEESNLEDLRLAHHKDQEGNIITDPDRSNPTRYRLERPLDTIRSFNAAAEGTSSRRSSYSRPRSQFGFDDAASRRSSYYGNGNQGFSPQRTRPGVGGGGYYRNSSYGFGPQSSVEESPGASQQYGPRTYRQPSGNYQNQNGYPGDSPVSTHSYHQSYDNMTSGSEENNKSTNPSSQNSSFDQLHQLHLQKQGHENPYTNDMAFGPAPANRAFPAYGAPEESYPRPMATAPLPPPQAAGPNNPNTRVPIKLNGSDSGPPPTQADLKKSASTKRQSWIKRRFSRRDS